MNVRVGAAGALTPILLAATVLFAGSYAASAADAAGGILASVVAPVDERSVVRVTGTDCYGGGVGLESSRRRLGDPLARKGSRRFRVAPQSSLSNQNGCPTALSTQANPRHVVVLPR